MKKPWLLIICLVVVFTTMLGGLWLYWANSTVVFKKTPFETHSIIRS